MMATALFATMIAGVTGCSPDATSSQNDSANAAFVLLAQAELARAQTEGVSAEQTSDLERLVANGFMTFDDVGRAVERTFTCFDDAGVPHSQLVNDGEAAFPEVTYTFGAPSGLSDEQGLAVADSCINEQSFYVERLYQGSPGYIDALATQFLAVRTAYVECVNSNGYNLSADVVYGEVLVLLQSDEPAAIGCANFLP